MAYVLECERVRHLLTVPVSVGGAETRFVFDTGIGLNLISASLAERAGGSPTGAVFTGRRMSGQEVSVPLGSLPSLQVGGLRASGVTVGIFDMGAAAGLDGIGGFLSLDCFRSVPVTIDGPAGLVIIEDQESLARRAESGTSVAATVEQQDGCSTDVFFPLELPNGRSILAEADTGSDSVVLNQPFAAELGIDLMDQGVRRTEGQDETGHTFTRYFTSLPGEIGVTGAPGIRHSRPEVMFQEIIHDGLAGAPFLSRFVVTYDLPGNRMIFAT